MLERRPDRARSVAHLVTLLLLVACETNKDANDAVDGTAPPADLSGTWDVITSYMGKQPSELTVTIDSQQIAVVAGSGAFTFKRDSGGFLATHTSGGSSRQIVVEGTAAGGMAFGAIPLDLSGTWKARNAGASDGLGCDGVLSPNDASAVCTGTRFPIWMDGYNPGAGTATVTKEATAPSMFGDLGGTWRVTFSKGGSCTFRFERSSFSADCGPELGGATITFSGSTASGSSTSGYEFSAHRR